MNWLCHTTDRVRVSSRLADFNRSYCHSFKFSFPDFSLHSFEILTWNIVYMNLSSCFTDYVQISSRLTYFHLSYPNFSVSPYKMTRFFWMNLYRHKFNTYQVLLLGPFDLCLKVNLWCSIVGATVTVHQFFCILLYFTLYCFSNTFRMLVEIELCNTQEYCQEYYSAYTSTTK